MREKMDRNDWPSANFDMMNALRASGYRQEIAEPFPLGQMQLTAADIDMPFTHYRRGLRMGDAEAFARWNYGAYRSLRRSFVSQADGLVWFSIEEDRPRELELTLAPVKQVREHPLLDAVAKAGKIQIKDSTVVFDTQVEDRRIGIAAQVLPAEGSFVEEKDGYLMLKGTGFTVKLATFTDEISADPWETGTKMLAAAADADYETALARHTALWQPQYRDVALTLSADDEKIAESNETLLDEAYEEAADPALYEKLWHFARYLFLSGTSKDGNPFPLYGLWCGEYGLPWTQHVANENVEILYSGAAVSGQFDALRGLIRYYTGQMDAFRENARKLFGCGGIWIPAYTAPESLNGVATTGPAVDVPVILNWISAAGWLSSLFCTCCRYTGDRELLKQEVLPFLIETARFYVDYVKFDAQGKCRIYPSVSPENTPGNLMPVHFSEDMGHICPCVENATMDFAVMKEVLQNLLAFTEEADCAALVTEGEREQWKNLLQAIPPYAIDEATGGVCEWIHPLLEEHPYHRHVSQMYPVFPGYEVRADNDPQLLKAFEISTRNRILGSKSGWAFAHLAALWCRLGDGEQSLQELDLLTKACTLENFFTLHNDWRHMGASMDLGDFVPVQLDALMGIANALQEMLLYSAPDVLHLLPALPGRLAEGRACGLYQPWGRLDIEWNADEGRAISHAAKDATITVLLPSGEKKSVSLRSGTDVELSFKR
jgi:alpha-L-fucosidase 2